MNLPVELGPEVLGDLSNLPSDKLRREAFSYMVRLKATPRLGLQLTAHPALGDLSDCRKIYFDERPGKPRYRIVYRLLPDESKPRKVDIIVVGRRANARVYIDALLRLGRSSPHT